MNRSPGPYIVFGVVLLILAVGVALSPETTSRPDPYPAYRTQRVAVPARARQQFFAAIAAGVAAFATGAVAQIGLSRAGVRTTLRTGIYTLLPGMALLTGGMWLPSLAMFIVGGVVTGAGGGLVFRGALVAAGSTAPPESRAEVFAGFFLGAYVGLSVPVIGLGIATRYIAARIAMLVFVVLMAVAIVTAVEAVLRAQQAQ